VGRSAGKGGGGSWVVWTFGGRGDFIFGDRFVVSGEIATYDSARASQSRIDPMVR
jgi:hypothetical protein